MRHSKPTGRSGVPLTTEAPTEQHSPHLSDIRLGAEPLIFGQLLDSPSPRLFRRLLQDAEAAPSSAEHQVILRLATELLEDVEAEAQLPASLLADLRAELSLGHALHHLAQGAIIKARPALQAALAAAEDGSGDVLLLGHVHEAIAQLNCFADGPSEAERHLRSAIELFRAAEQQPELASALFRSAAWWLEGGDRIGCLSRVREALESFEMELPPGNQGSVAWTALERSVGSDERPAGVWAPLCFAVENELAAVELAEPRRRRVQGEAWAIAALATLERGGDALAAGKMLTRAECCRARDVSVSAERLTAVTRAFQHLTSEPERLAPVVAELSWAANVLAAWSQHPQPLASLWSRAVTTGEARLAVFDPEGISAT